MGMIARSKNQVTLIYSSNNRSGQKAYAYLKASDKPYLAIDISKTKISDTQWVELAKALNKRVGDLLNKSLLKMEIKDTEEFDDHDWIKIIQKNDEALSDAIVIKGEITKQINNPSAIMEFFQPDSAGMEQSPSDNNSLDIERTTEDEKFIDPK